MTLLEITQSVINNTRRSDKVDYIHESVNLSLKEIVQLEPFNLLRSEVDDTLPAGQNSIQFPLGAAQLVQVRVWPPTTEIPANDPTALSTANLAYEVRIMDQRTLGSWFPNLQLNSRGIPEYCYATSTSIIFIPPTSETRMVRILIDGYAPELELDTDESPLPSCDNAVIAWATARVFKSLGLFADSEQWDAEYMKAIRYAKSENQRKPGQLRQMRGAQTIRPRYIDPRVNTYTRQSYEGNVR